MAIPQISLSPGNAVLASPISAPRPPEIADAWQLDTFEQAPSQAETMHAVAPLQVEGQARRQAIDGMVAHDTGLRPASERELAGLRGDLSKVDTAVLQYAQKRGAKISVVHPGDDLGDAKVLREQHPSDIDRQMPQMRALADRVHGDASRFDGPLAELAAQREKLVKEKGLDGPFNGFASPFGPHDKDVDALDARIGKLNQERLQAVGKDLENNELPVGDFHYPSPPASGGMIGNAFAMMNNMPHSTEMMARIHGARTAEEVGQFNRWVEQINGDALAKARKESLHGLEAMIAQHPEDADAKKLLANARAHPETIPVDQARYGILVPDYYWYRHGDMAMESGPAKPPTERPLHLDEHDYGTLQGWNDGQTGKIDKPYDQTTSRGTTLLGQAFLKGNVNRLIVGSNATSDGTPIHELGHIVDGLVEKDDPKFYAAWKQNLEKAYEAAGEGGPQHQISGYSRTNRREYLAEGFMTYYDDPKLLKMRDPQLFNLVGELAGRAAELGRNVHP
jgi:hypothetical protein